MDMNLGTNSINQMNNDVFRKSFILQHFITFSALLLEIIVKVDNQSNMPVKITKKAVGDGSWWVQEFPDGVEAHLERTAMV